jgi:hypothetical protein
LSITVLRSTDQWWVENPHNGAALTVATSASTTAELLADRDAVDTAAAELASGAAQAVPELGLVSPVEHR